MKSILFLSFFVCCFAIPLALAQTCTSPGSQSFNFCFDCHSCLYFQQCWGPGTNYTFKYCVNSIQGDQFDTQVGEEICGKYSCEDKYESGPRHHFEGNSQACMTTSYTSTYASSNPFWKIYCKNSINNCRLQVTNLVICVD